MTPKLHHPHRWSSCLLPAILTLLVSATSLFAVQPGTSPVKIFILAGQSNMQGQGNMSPVTTPGTLEYTVANDPGGDYQFVLDGGGWASLDDVWIHYERTTSTLLTGDLTTGYGASATTIGPELGFGSVVGGHYDNQVLLVKAAWGGKSLAVDFRPPSSGGTTGFYYGEILRLVQDAVTNLGTYFPGYDGQGYEIAGFGWHQGWNDRVNQTRNDEYEFNMANFIRDIRSSDHGLGIPDLPFVIATTGMSGWDETHPRALSLMNAQLAVAQYPEFQGNVFTVDTRDFYRPVSESPANQGYHWHRNAATYLDIGLAMGEAMTALAPDLNPPDIAADNAVVMAGEGSEATNTGTFSDTAGDTVTISADIGTVMQTGTDSGTWSWSYTPADGPVMSTVTVTATDALNEMTTTTFNLDVNNVAPAVVLDSLPDIDENGMVTLSGTITDPGTLDSFTIDIDWGDPLSPGNTEPTLMRPASATGTQTFTLSHQYLDDNPSGTGRDTYTVQVTVTDDDTGSGNDSESFQISNVRPQLALDPVMSVDENGSAMLTGTITDPGSLDSFSMFVDWGDPLSPGNFEMPTFGPGIGGSQSFMLSHQYPDDNPSGTPVDGKTILVLLLDDEGASTTGIAGVDINNVAPEITSLNATPSPGGVTLDVAFTDPGTPDVHTATIQWGDGSSTPVTIPVGDRSFQAMHSYAMEPPPGGYPISVTVSDDDTGSDTEALAPPTPPGGPSEINGVMRLANGDIEFGFDTELGAVYRVQYSSDLVLWKDAVPDIVGDGSRVPFVDVGPPVTESDPSTVPQRFYHYIRLPGMMPPP